MTPDADARNWPCEAYGPDGLLLGVLCFIAAGFGARWCGSPSECSRVMAEERERVYARISELAAAGYPDFVFLAGEFAGPEDLLNGKGEGE
jgi:hypothetical protein